MCLCALWKAKLAAVFEKKPFVILSPVLCPHDWCPFVMLHRWSSCVHHELSCCTDTVPRPLVSLCYIEHCFGFEQLYRQISVNMDLKRAFDSLRSLFYEYRLLRVQLTGLILHLGKLYEGRPTWSCTECMNSIQTYIHTHCLIVLGTALATGVRLVRLQQHCRVPMQ